MGDIAASFGLAMRLIAGGDAALWRIVALSFEVSLASAAFACAIGLPLGAFVAIHPFRGRRAVVVALNTLLGLPSVVVGLVVYLLLSRAGPLGSWGILFTPAAIVIAQTLLVLPIVTALARQFVEDAWHEYRELFPFARCVAPAHHRHASVGPALLAAHGDPRSAGSCRLRSGRR
jgi:tungstate transport system permease protein